METTVRSGTISALRLDFSQHSAHSCSVHSVHTWCVRCVQRPEHDNCLSTVNFGSLACESERLERTMKIHGEAADIEHWASATSTPLGGTSYNHNHCTWCDSIQSAALTRVACPSCHFFEYLHSSESVKFVSQPRCCRTRWRRNDGESHASDQPRDKWNSWLCLQKCEHDL